MRHANARAPVPRLSLQEQVRVVAELAEQAIEQAENQGPKWEPYLGPYLEAYLVRRASVRVPVPRLFPVVPALAEEQTPTASSRVDLTMVDLWEEQADSEKMKTYWRLLHRQ